MFSMGGYYSARECIAEIPAQVSFLTQVSRLKVFLMTSGDRYQQYEMEAADGKVCFNMSQRSEIGALVHDLGNMHVSTIDTADKKVVCRSSRHFGCKISTRQGHRNLFFLSYQ